MGVDGNDFDGARRRRSDADDDLGSGSEGGRQDQASDEGQHFVFHGHEGISFARGLLLVGIKPNTNEKVAADEKAFGLNCLEAGNGNGQEPQLLRSRVG
jgi:hypothetical protein